MSRWQPAKMLQAAHDGVVRLDHFSERDLQALVAGDSDAELRRRFGTPDAFEPSIEHSRTVLVRWAAEWRRGERFTFAVRSRGADDLLGGCEVRPLSDGSGNVSYWTYPAHRGQGIASRALGLAAQYAFEQLGLSELEARIDQDNVASIRAATRAGFVECGKRAGQLLFSRSRALRSAGGA